MVGSRRQGWALYAAMLAMFVIGVVTAYPAEQHGSPALREAGIEMSAEDGTTGGNLQDKEQRFGIANSALWATATTDASNGRSTPVTRPSPESAAWCRSSTWRPGR